MICNEIHDNHTRSEETGTALTNSTVGAIEGRIYFCYQIIIEAEIELNTANENELEKYETYIKLLLKLVNWQENK